MLFGPSFFPSPLLPEVWDSDMVAGTPAALLDPEATVQMGAMH